MKTIEIISGGKKAQFTTKSVTLDGKEFFYSRMTSVACDAESHCYKFTYEGETILLPYEPKDAKILNAIFKQVQTIEEKRRFTQALAAADAERLRAAAAAHEAQKSAPVQTSEPVEDPSAEAAPAETKAEENHASKKLSIAEIMESPAGSEKTDSPAEESQDSAETADEPAEKTETEAAETPAEENKLETKAERKARKQAERQAKKEAKAKAKAEAKAAKEAAKAGKSDSAAAVTEEAPAEITESVENTETSSTEAANAEKPETAVNANAETAEADKEAAVETSKDNKSEDTKSEDKKSEEKPKKEKKEKTPMDPEKKARLKKSLTRFGIIVAIIVVLSVVYFFVFGTNNQPTQVAPNSTESQQYDDIDQLIDDLQ